MALGRLNERVPPTPFVVRLLDAGAVPAHDGTRTLDLPWLAIEHVHGGAEGTTLEERVHHALRQARAAFDPERAARAVACLAGGLVRHPRGRRRAPRHQADQRALLRVRRGRDPQDRRLRHRPRGGGRGGAGTFGGLTIGTPGYAPPEQLGRDPQRVGPWTDVFALAAVVFYLLTGEEYFPARSNGEGVVLAHSPDRRRLADAPALHAALRARPAACATLDAALARATAANPDHRPQSADVLAAMIVPALRADATRGRTGGDRRAKTATVSAIPSARRRGRLDGAPAPGRLRRGPQRRLGQRSPLPRRDLGGRRLLERHGVAARGGAGAARARRASTSCTAWARTRGCSAATAPSSTPTAPRASRRSSRGRDPDVRFVLASGDVADLAVFAGVEPGGPPSLHGVAAGHWIKPAALPKAASITSLSQLDEERWLVTGRASAGEGFAVLYEPLMWEVKRLKTPAVRAYLASTARPELGLGLIAGSDGRIVRFHGDTVTPIALDGAPDLSAVALDPEGRAWAASMGKIWTADPEAPEAWRCVFEDPAPSAPFVSLFADVGVVIAMTADGGIVEGRLGRGNRPPAAGSPGISGIGGRGLREGVAFA